MGSMRYSSRVKQRNITTHNGDEACKNGKSFRRMKVELANYTSDAPLFLRESKHLSQRPRTVIMNKGRVMFFGSLYFFDLAFALFFRRSESLP